MKGTQSDVRFILGLLVLSLAGNAFLARRLATGGGGARPLPTRAEFEKALSEQTRQAIPVSADGARVVVVKFNDYQCPPCRATHEAFEPVIARLQKEQPGAIKLVVKDFPLAGACNRSVAGPFHAAACEAAAAVRLAGSPEKAQALSEWLYAHQANLTADSVRAGYRQIVGGDWSEPGYARALASVREDVELGMTLGVAGTPTFFVNGLRVDAPTPELFAAAIERELSRAARS